MDKVYVCYSVYYEGIDNSEFTGTIGVASTEEKAIELIKEYAKLHYADRDVCPCNICMEDDPVFCENCDKDHRKEDEWRKVDDDPFNRFIQCYEGEYDSSVRHYYLPFKLDQLHKIES